MKKDCKNCVSRLICPNYQEGTACLGFNDEGCFKGTLELGLFGLVEENDIERFFERIKAIQVSKNTNNLEVKCEQKNKKQI